MADTGVSQDRIEFWVTTGLQAITIVVLVFFWFAAWKQGRAADKLARATRAQTDANRRMAAATDTQNEIARVQMEETFRPLLYLAWKTSGTAAWLSLRNDGGGPALDCAWHYGKANGHRPSTQKLEYESIGAHQEIPFGVQIHKANEDGLTILYKSVTGKPCATEITWQGPRFHCRYIPDAAEHHHAPAEPDHFESQEAETPWLTASESSLTSSDPQPATAESRLASSDSQPASSESPSEVAPSDSYPRYSWLNEVPLPDPPSSESTSPNSASSDAPSDPTL